MASGQDLNWLRIDRLLEQVLDLPDSRRKAWLDETLADDPGVRKRLYQLLQLERAERDRFDTLVAMRDQMLTDVSEHLLDNMQDLRVGARYGQWRLVERIGEGGLSLVYRAERADGRYEQTVALKILRASAFRSGAIRHFIRERQILSSLNHPGLVRIIDGGETATGAPWLVMEYVQGLPITTYCEAEVVSLEGRLLLLTEVAEATQAAHNQLVIHRDIKPENVLVETDGRVRLLDFGISQFFEPDTGTNGGATSPAMTPAYASPEQLRHDPVTTVSDVYQLGRLMQDLTADFDLSPQQQAVLDKALAQRLTDRYPTASGFSGDLKRLISGEAPEVRPDKPLEALRRAIRRNRMASILTVVLLIGLTVWAISTSIYAHALKEQEKIALAEADRANRGKQVLLNLFRRSDPLEVDGQATQTQYLLKLLEPSLDEIRAELSDDPVLQASLIGRLARARERGADLEGGLELAHEAEQILEQHEQTAPQPYGLAKAYRAALQIELGDHEVGEAGIEQALEILRTSPLEDVYALDGMLLVAWSYDGNPVRQRELFEQALERAQVVGAVGPLVEVHTGLARAQSELGDIEEAEATIREAVALAETNYGADHPRLAMPLSDLGNILRNKGDLEGAIGAQRRALRLSQQIYDAEHPVILSHRNNIALSLSTAGKYDQAIEEFTRIRDARRLLFGDDAVEVADTIQNLGTMQARAGRLEEALVSLEEVREIYEMALPEDNARRAFPDLTIANTLISLGRYDDAARSGRRAFDHLSANLPEGHFASEIARCLVGIALLRGGNAQEAREPIGRAAAALSGLAYAPEAYRTACLDAASELGVSP